MGCWDVVVVKARGNNSIECFLYQKLSNYNKIKMHLLSINLFPGGHTQKFRRYPILSRTTQTKTPTYVVAPTHNGKILIGEGARCARLRQVVQYTSQMTKCSDTRVTVHFVVIVLHSLTLYKLLNGRSLFVLSSYSKHVENENGYSTL